MFVLTDIDANRHYCASLSFTEPIAVHPTKQDDDDIDDESITSMDGSTTALCTTGAQHHSIMYSTKCLVLVSQHNYREALKVCHFSLQCNRHKWIHHLIIATELPHNHIHGLYREYGRVVGSDSKQYPRVR
jgi:hypothetical protein